MYVCLYVYVYVCAHVQGHMYVYVYLHLDEGPLFSETPMLLKHDARSPESGVKKSDVQLHTTLSGLAYYYS